MHPSARKQLLNRPRLSGRRTHLRRRSAKRSYQCSCWRWHPSASGLLTPVLPSARNLQTGLRPHLPAGHSWLPPLSNRQKTAPALLSARNQSPHSRLSNPSAPRHLPPVSLPAKNLPSVPLPYSNAQSHTQQRHSTRHALQGELPPQHSIRPEPSGRNFLHSAARKNTHSPQSESGWQYRPPR